MYFIDIYLSLQFVYYHINLFNVLYDCTHVVSTDKEFEFEILTNDNVTSAKQFVSAML